MIYLEKNTTTPIAIELAQTIPSNLNFYLFEFIWEEVPMQDPRYYYTPTLVNSTRFSLFDFTELSPPFGVTGDADNVPICLNPGQYRYNVYAGSAAPVFSNISAFIASGAITTGRMVVEAATGPANVYPNEIPATTPSVYE